MRNMTENTSLSLIDNDTRFKIRSLWLEGKTIKEIQSTLDISEGTWDNYFYLDKYGFRNFILDVKKEYMLTMSEKTSDKILSYKTTAKDVRLLQIQQKEAEFLRETQGKDLGYSKRIETIGLNLNKTEPLDEEQKKKLDKLFKKGSNIDIRNVEYTEKPIDKPLNDTVSDNVYCATSRENTMGTE